MAGSVIGSLIGGAGNIIGGLIGADAAGDAADAQVKAANQAAATQRYMYDTTRNDLAPYRAAGGLALSRLANHYGLGGYGDVGTFNNLTQFAGGAAPSMGTGAPTTTNGGMGGVAAGPAPASQVPAGMDPNVWFNLSPEQQASVRAEQPEMTGGSPAMVGTSGFTMPGGEQKTAGRTATAQTAGGYTFDPTQGPMLDPIVSGGNTYVPGGPMWMGGYVPVEGQGNVTQLMNLGRGIYRQAIDADRPGSAFFGQVDPQTGTFMPVTLADDLRAFPRRGEDEGYQGPIVMSGVGAMPGGSGTGETATNPAADAGATLAATAEQRQNSAWEGFLSSPEYRVSTEFTGPEGLRALTAAQSARGALALGSDGSVANTGGLREFGRYQHGLGLSTYNDYANRLSALAGIGQTTSMGLGSLGAQYAGNIGSAQLAAGAYRGAGIVGGANALTPGLAYAGNQIGSAIGNYLGGQTGYGPGPVGNMLNTAGQLVDVF